MRTQNVTACMALANIVKTSLGPVGLDKMLVDSIGDVTITNDGATILKQLEVDHPAAKVLVELAELQDKEVGDGTTSVVILAAELLKRANELVRAKIHPTIIMSGYRLAVKEAVKYIKAHLTVSTDKMEREFLLSAASTAMSSKIIGSQNAAFFSALAVDAVLSIKRDDAQTGEAKYPISCVACVASVPCERRSVAVLAPSLIFTRPSPAATSTLSRATARARTRARSCAALRSTAHAAASRCPRA